MIAELITQLLTRQPLKHVFGCHCQRRESSKVQHVICWEGTHLSCCLDGDLTEPLAPCPHLCLSFHILPAGREQHCGNSPVKEEQSHLQTSKVVWEGGFRSRPCYPLSVQQEKK